MNELVAKTAVQQRGLIMAGEVSARELLAAYLQHIEATNPRLNAIVTLAPEHAEQLAMEVDRKLARGEHPGSLAGLPTVHKDLLETKNIRTTYGSRRYANHVPDHNALIVQRQIDAGAITLGKSNTPEWGAGSQTFNDVFGATRNPYDTSRTCGGSSGGAAVALAARMTAIADGSDLGGSLRNPAAFCNVVGLRPSVGRVPAYPASMGWNTTGVVGPMARTVEDCALMLAAIAGPDARSPLSLTEPGNIFADQLKCETTGQRIAFSPDFGGQLPIEPDIKAVIAKRATLLESMGCLIEQACPDFGGADQVFKTIRAFGFAAAHGDAIRQSPEMYKHTIIWNTESGLKLSARDLFDAEKSRTQLYQRMMVFFERFDFLILPVTQVSPFPVSEEYVTNIDGTEMETYIDWMKSCYYISVTGLPALSLPAGFTSGGLPVGLQIVAPPWQELSLLKFAYMLQQAEPLWRRVPAPPHPAV